MSTRTFFLNSNVAQYGEEELNSIQKFLFGQGILNTLGSSWEDWIANGDLKVSQRGAGANMSVDIKAGWGLLNTTRSTVTFKVFCQSIGVTNLVVSANALGTNRVDAVIMRVSRTAVPNLLANNVVTLEVITGTGVSALSDGAITTAISNDDFIRLADITVTNGDTEITDAQITDTRVRSKTNNVFSLNPEVIEMKVLASDPVNLVEGMLWYNTGTDTLNFYNGSIVKQLGGTVAYLADDDTTVDGVDQSQTTQDASRAVGEADATTKNNKLTQSFIAGKTNITGVKLYKVADTGTFTGTVTVSLFASSAGSPTGSALATVTLSNAVYLALAVGEFTATFASPYTMTLASTYHIVITTSTSDNSNHPNLGTNSAGGYANGSVKFFNTTDGWTAVSTIDLYFKTLQTTVSKVVRTDPTGKIDYSLIPLQKNLGYTYELGEDLLISDCVYIKTVPIGLNHGTAVGVVNQASPITQAVNATTNANRLILAQVHAINGQPLTDITCTYAGQAMTLLDSRNHHTNRYTYYFGIIAPATGSNNFVATWSGGFQGSAQIIPYYGVAQTLSLVTAFNSGTGTTLTNTITTSDINQWVASFSEIQSGSVTSGTNDTILVSTTNCGGSGDSGNLATAGSKSISAGAASNGSNAWSMFSVVISQYRQAYDAVFKASATSTTTSTPTVGFALTDGTTGEMGTIITDGTVDNLTNLVTGTPYYVSNTAGQLSSSAGTNTRKIGIATSPTSLKITNIW